MGTVCGLGEERVVKDACFITLELGLDINNCA